MKKKIMITMLIVIGIGIVGGGYYYYTTNQVQNTFKTISPSRGEIKDILEEEGTIESSVIHTYYSSGMKKIAKVYKEIGDEVKSGERLIDFDHNIDLEKAKIDKEISAVRASYNEATSGVGEEELNAIQLEIDNIKRTLVDANNALEKIIVLYDEGIATDEELDATKLRVDQLEGQIKILENQYNLLSKGASKYVRDQYNAQIQSLMVSKQLIEASREDTYIDSNINGIVTEKNVFENSIPTAGTIMLEVQDKNNLVAYVDFLVEDIARIKEGMEVIITDEKTDLLIENIKIDKIYPKANTTVSELGIEQKRVRVEINLPEAYNALTIGSNVTVQVIIETKEDVLMLPKDTIYEIEGNDMVTKLVNGETVEEKVMVGLEYDEMVEVISGVEEEDQIVIDSFE